MSSADLSHADPHDALGHADDGAVHAHIDPMWLYSAIFASLIFLTVVTVGASYIDFGSANTVIAVIIATIKASLVAIFFMHLRHDKRFHALVFIGGLFFLSFLFLFTLTDIGTRNEVDDYQGRVIHPASDKLPAGAASAEHKEEKK